MTSPEQVLSDFIDAWNGGRRPRALEYLRRVPAGPQRDELAEQLTTWLEVAPAPAYDEAARAAIRAEPAVLAALAPQGDPWPALLPRLRERAGLSVRDLARRLTERFALTAPDAEPRAAAYLEQLERGDLEPPRVSARLLDALGALLHVSPEALRATGSPDLASLRPALGQIMLRADADADDWMLADIDALSRAALTPAPPRMDELDRLFTGGPDG